MTHKTVNLMAPKSDRKWCETTYVQPIIASHLPMRPFRATTFPMSHFGKNYSAPHLVHH